MPEQLDLLAGFSRPQAEPQAAPTPLSAPPAVQPEAKADPPEDAPKASPTTLLIIDTEKSENTVTQRAVHARSKSNMFPNDELLSYNPNSNRARAERSACSQPATRRQHCA